MHTHSTEPNRVSILKANRLLEQMKNRGYNYEKATKAIIAAKLLEDAEFSKAYSIAISRKLDIINIPEDDVINLELADLNIDENKRPKLDQEVDNDKTVLRKYFIVHLKNIINKCNINMSEMTLNNLKRDKTRFPMNANQFDVLCEDLLLLSPSCQDEEFLRTFVQLYKIVPVAKNQVSIIEQLVINIRYRQSSLIKKLINKSIEDKLSIIFNDEHENSMVIQFILNS